MGGYGWGRRGGQLGCFPLDPGEWSDTDGDGVGDNSDAFPLDPGEWSDTDGDGVGDNSDVFFENPYEWEDTDGDGVGDNSDLFPFRSDEWQDTDGDGYGENEDAFPSTWVNGMIPTATGWAIIQTTILSMEKGGNRNGLWGEITLITLISGLIYISGRRDKDN